MNIILLKKREDKSLSSGESGEAMVSRSLNKMTRQKKSPEIEGWPKTHTLSTLASGVEKLFPAHKIFTTDLLIVKGSR